MNAQQTYSILRAAVCVPLLLLLLLLRVLLLAAAGRHCVPATQGVPYTAVLTVKLCFSNDRTLLYTPWQYGCFCAASVDLFFVLLFATMGMRKAAGECQPTQRSPTFIT